MNFVQIEFVGFMALVFTAYWLLRERRLQNALLVAASAVFYGWVHPWFLILLYFSATLDFLMGRAIERFPHRRKAFLALSLAGNLTMLGYFKYFDFFVDNVVTALESAGVRADLTTLGIFLPVGISFYTFQTMAYTIDVYRGELKARRDFLDYLVYVSFFPQLVAGPIERAGRLLPQVEADRKLDWTRVASGLSLAMWGAFKKVCIADTIAPYVDKVFLLDDPAGPVLWAGVLGFMAQIYSDFSGYTDIARGTARMLGFELVENFRNPYMAASTPEFWQRWHMSLSTWIRDYILAPLLGGVHHITLARFGFAVTVTFVVIGVWHGASWNFAVFGLFHGFWMFVYSAIERYRPAWFDRVPLGRPVAIAFHFVAVSMVGSLIFRESRLDRLVEHLTTPPFQGSRDDWVAVAVMLGITATACTPYLLSSLYLRFVHPWIERTVWLLPTQTTGWTIAAMAMFVFYRVSAYDFIYFQF
ncbi:MAG: MBOAT family protein [Alphaproteobacteria bacterium]|nr:MBOAT family protein [Alphaproteobacteria bacterium]